MSSPNNILIPGWIGVPVVWSGTVYDNPPLYIPASIPGSTTSGLPIVTGLLSTSTLSVGQPVSGTGIPINTTILYIDSLTQIHLSANATATGTPTLAFGAGGNPHDISGWQFFLTVKNSYNDPDTSAVFLRDWAIGASPAGVSGFWSNEWPESDTTNILQGSTFVWDIKVITQSGGDPEMFLSGTIVFQNTVGRRIISEANIG